MMEKTHDSPPRQPAGDIEQAGLFVAIIPNLFVLLAAATTKTL